MKIIQMVGTLKMTQDDIMISKPKGVYIAYINFRKYYLDHLIT